MNSTIPPDQWFASAFDVIRAAKLRLTVDDFKLQSRLNTYTIGQSYSYRIDVLNKLIRDEVIKILDNRLYIGTIDNLDWLNMALESGIKPAWHLVDEILGETDETQLFDQETLKRIGDKGEAFVVKQLHETLDSSLHREIKHVAKINDFAGFDIYAPSVLNPDNRFLLEVKTSTKNVPGQFEFFLSRNEYEVGRKNRNWCIVCVRQQDERMSIIGHVYCYQIESRLPRDVNELGQWMKSKVVIEDSLLRTDLP